MDRKLVLSQWVYRRLQGQKNGEQSGKETELLPTGYGMTGVRPTAQASNV
jgi:hypothetical protein